MNIVFMSMDTLPSTLWARDLYDQMHMSNREWGHVGTNYFRGLFALAFQAFLMMVCVAIYAALIGSIRVSSDIHSALFGTMAYTVILCFSLLKTGSLSKQIFGSH